MDKMIAFCGLNCAKCDAYQATVNNNQILREKTAKLWSELNNVTILPEHINCFGCRTDGVKTLFCEKLCEIRQCALNKEVETCGACKNMKQCELVNKIISNNTEALKNLKG